jgi:hypothetical protein
MTMLTASCWQFDEAELSVFPEYSTNHVLDTTKAPEHVAFQKCQHPKYLLSCSHAINERSNEKPISINCASFLL